MKSTETRDASLVVIEYGGSWPRWIPPGNSGDLAVVAQHYPGPSDSLVRQVASRITRLEAGGWRLRRMVLMTNERTDAEATSARQILARGLIARLQQVGGGSFTLTAEPGSRTALTLGVLAKGLEPAARRAQVYVDVRVGGGEPRQEAVRDAGGPPGPGGGPGALRRRRVA